MKRVEDNGQDVPQEHGSPSAAQAAGFAAVMQRLNSRSAAERAELVNEAEGAVLGYEAYGLGHEYLERGAYDKARRWLKVAARHGVPGAEATLAETDAREIASFALGVVQAGGSLIPRGADGSVPRGTTGQPVRTAGQDGMPDVGDICGVFTRGLEPVTVDRVALARAEAARIAEQARRDAAGILDEARRQARDDLRAAVRAAAQARDDVRAAVRVAERVRQMASGLLDKTRRQAEGLRAARQEVSQIQISAQPLQGEPVDVVVPHAPLKIRRVPAALGTGFDVDVDAVHCAMAVPDGWWTAEGGPSLAHRFVLLGACTTLPQGSAEPHAQFLLSTHRFSASLPDVYATAMSLVGYLTDGEETFWPLSDRTPVPFRLGMPMVLKGEAMTKIESEADQDSAEPEGVGVEEAGHATCR
ncbi:hypothetical protein [Streptomyces sp. NBC_00328]|uniref:hypothetical protein n=1 Tax=Streptomyces sp. NBC_00328 TaxID=2903646 RepID=UPI002E2807F6|nr:hypothetical protein [Streptomyces sp. NBC_00328]